MPRVDAIVLQGRCGALLRAFGWSALSGRYSITEEMWCFARHILVAVPSVGAAVVILRRCSTLLGASE